MIRSRSRGRLGRCREQGAAGVERGVRAGIKQTAQEHHESRHSGEHDAEPHLPKNGGCQLTKVEERDDDAGSKPGALKCGAGWRSGI